jgi:hypothetical protein
MTFDLKSDIAHIQLGWNARAPIAARAEAIMNGHPLSEDLADEIDDLQEVESEMLGAQPASDLKGMERWSLSLEKWAPMLPMSFRRGRSFWMPINSTKAQAVASAQAIFPGDSIQLGDVFCVSRLSDAPYQHAAE